MPSFSQLRECSAMLAVLPGLQVTVIESKKDLYQAEITGRTVYGSSRDGSSSEDSVYKLMVFIGPEVRDTCLRKHVMKGVVDMHVSGRSCIGHSFSPP